MKQLVLSFLIIMQILLGRWQILSWLAQGVCGKIANSTQFVTAFAAADIGDSIELTIALIAFRLRSLCRMQSINTRVHIPGDCEVGGSKPPGSAIFRGI